ncbi:calcium-binding protein [Baaleninema sp.]|uniref:calcium-binding protein n=1 Tax=Baaleninema sp. TaxID=3101197 RepID=UPI003D010BE4
MDEFLMGDANANALDGTELADTIIALGGDDTVDGGLADDVLAGNAGRDMLSGDEGNDLIVAGRDEDTVRGGAGDDVLSGNIGFDIIFGDEGNDLLLGGQDEDILDGGVGNDTLIGDFGVNGLNGGEGADVFVIRTDVARTDPSRTAINGQVPADVIIDFQAGIDKIALTEGLTEANLAFQEFSFPLAAIGDEIIDPEIQAALDNLNLDPDGNGSLEMTFVREINGAMLAVTLNTTAAELSGSFISV